MSPDIRTGPYPGSLLIGGVVAEVLGIQAVYYVGGCLLVLAAVIGWAGSVSVREAGTNS